MVRSTGRDIQASENVHDGRLPGPGRAHDRDKIPGLDREGHPAQGVDVRFAHAIRLHQIAAENEAHIPLGRCDGWLPKPGGSAEFGRSPRAPLEISTPTMISSPSLIGPSVS